MTRTQLVFPSGRWIFLAVLAFVSAGCEMTSTPTGPGILREREDVIKTLPKGVTLETPIVPDKMYGDGKTVEDALRHLQASVRDGVLYDGGLGGEIRFDPEPPGTPKKTTKKAGKAKKGRR